MATQWQSTAVLGRGKPHPRFYGTFPRFLGKYVREEKVLPLQEAIRKITSFSAEKLGLEKRGSIVEGFYADLVVFDPDKIIDKATFENPHQYPAGIPHVVVNGVPGCTQRRTHRQTAGKDPAAGENRCIA